MQNIVITIGREYGSGGKYIGEKVAEKLNIPFYDKEIITQVYEKNGINYSKLETYDEHKKSTVLKNFEKLTTLDSERIFEDSFIHEQISKTIKSFADKGSCVILGRNANNILKCNHNVIRIFIYSNDVEFKIKRKMELENLSYEDAKETLKIVDKRRRKYYESLNSKQSWGDKKDYDYLIDSSILGVDGTADLIVDLYRNLSSLEKN